MEMNDSCLPIDVWFSNSRHGSCNYMYMFKVTIICRYIFCSFVLFYVSLVLNFAIFKSVRI